MKYTSFNKDNLILCGYPKEAPGWVDGVYYPRVIEKDYKDALECIEVGNEYTVFNAVAWKEVEETGYGVYFYEESANFRIKIDNANYKVVVTLANPTATEYKAHIRANNILKAPEITVGAGEEKDVEFNICIVGGEVRLAFLPGHVADVAEERLTGSVYVKSVEIKLADALLPGVKPSIYLASDSTVQPYGENTYPLTGWGQELHLFFKEEEADEDRHLCMRTVDGPNVIIENRAIGGRSSKSFIEEGRLDAILETIRPEDYLFIQWGHNDATAVRPNRYVAPADFDKYIQYYIDAARQRGAIPVLVTPVARRNFDEPGGFKISFEEYRQQMIKLAKEQNVVLLDLGKESAEWVGELGPEGSKDVFMWLRAGEYPDGAYADGLSDNTHLQEYGAMHFANMIAKLIKEYEGDWRQLDALKPYAFPRKEIGKSERQLAARAAVEATATSQEDATMVTGFAMQELTIDGPNANFLLNWNSVEGAVSYRAYRRVKAAGKEMPAEVVRELTKEEKDTATTLPFAAPATGDVYEYYIVAVFGDGKEGTASRIIEVNTAK
ncbi:MAG: rhamnogalacturonan acetylesterase [Lachnospiraceae bacterium]|nr:rhamnogalacturonan acetylesterase [Lachnospiraceae bacterium]